jgi:hypothetical protein
MAGTGKYFEDWVLLSRQGVWIHLDWVHQQGNGPSDKPEGVAMFANISTKTLLAMNGQYLREYQANPTEANLAAVIQSSTELSNRGA